jgi:hypothetical protein
VTVVDGQNGQIPAGADVWADSDTGERIQFEAGRGLHDVLAGKSYAVASTRNALKPHIWSEEDVCLSVGTTELYIQGHHKADLPFDDLPAGKAPGRWVLLQTNPANPALACRSLVRVIEVEDRDDPLVADPVTGHAITRLAWETAQALPFEMDMTALEVHANLVPVTAGRTEVKYFSIGPSTDPEEQPEAIERTGPSGSVAYLFTLPCSEPEALLWVGDEARRAQPEVRLMEMKWQAGALVENGAWTWRRSLLGTNSSQPYDRHFTLDDGTWERVAGYRRDGEEIVHYDYSTGAGATIRFGDGEFGQVPDQGAVFRATYRVGRGRAGNLPADSITGFESALNFVSAVANPLPLTNGLDPETAEEVRQLAPEAFRAVTYRAVRPEDYAEAVERLDWVQRAGATLRWTGSWLSVFATPDPYGATVLSTAQRAHLREQLDRFRQAGREALGAEPRYADLDLDIKICVEPHAYQGETKEAVMRALMGKKGVRPVKGFFDPDNFTFGTALHRSALEAAIQAVPGVRAVECMRIRHRGRFDWRPFPELAYEVGMYEVIRLENDPLHPERGSLHLSMEGGA